MATPRPPVSYAAILRRDLPPPPPPPLSTHPPATAAGQPPEEPTLTMAMASLPPPLLSPETVAMAGPRTPDEHRLALRGLMVTPRDREVCAACVPRSRTTHTGAEEMQGVLRLDADLRAFVTAPPYVAAVGGGRFRRA
jgi:hypothetical protein